VLGAIDLIGLATVFNMSNGSNSDPPASGQAGHEPARFAPDEQD